MGVCVSTKTGKQDQQKNRSLKTAQLGNDFGFAFAPCLPFISSILCQAHVPIERSDPIATDPGEHETSQIDDNPIPEHVPASPSELLRMNNNYNYLMANRRLGKSV